MPDKSLKGNVGSQPGAAIENKAVKPAGLLPKNTQQLVILGVAVVMILIMWLTGSTKHVKSSSASLSTPPVQPPDSAAVEDFKRAIQQQQAATRQPISPANLERLQALGLAGDVPVGSTVVPPTTDTGAPQPGGVLGGSTGTQPPLDPIKEDQKKRTYLSLFAPNVAFTSRKGREDAQTSLDAPVSQPEAPGKPQTDATLPSGPAPAVVPNQAGSGDVRATADQVIPANSFAGKRYVIFEGTVVETLLINRLNGTFSGPVNCLVTTDVYSHDRQHLLIPAGTKVLGEAKKVEAFGQQRLAVYFHRLIMPDGYSVNLDQFKGLNQTGETALRDKVNNHYLQIFGASLAVGILGGIAEVGT